MEVKYVKRAEPVLAEDVKALRETVEAIIDKVRQDGDAALAHYAKTLDNYEGPIRIGEAEIEAAKREVPDEIKRGIDFGIERLTAFAEAQRAQIKEFEQEMLPGIFMGHRIIPVDSTACYVPAGRYPVVSAPFHTIVPAKVAGVKRIITASPPGRIGRIHPSILYGMAAQGVDEIYCLGGAQAIAAFAYGTETIQPCDMVIGPGNKYVTEAKRQVYGKVGMEMLAGPSECLVIADETARAEWVAADLLAQCEHDPDARGALATTSEQLANEVLEQIERQLAVLTTGEVTRASWDKNGEVVVTATLEDACEWTNEWAPEHLEVHTKNPRETLPYLRNYGSLFLGEMAAETFADKHAGTNHVLPTGAGAKHHAGLSVFAFLKLPTHQWMDEAGARLLAPYSVAQSAYEGMDGHRRAALIRLTGTL